MRTIDQDFDDLEKKIGAEEIDIRTPMDEMVLKQLDKIEKMDSVSLEDYMANVIKYSVPSKAKTRILEACEKKLEKSDRSSAMVEKSTIGEE